MCMHAGSFLLCSPWTPFIIHPTHIPIILEYMTSFVIGHHASSLDIQFLPHGMFPETIAHGCLSSLTPTTFYVPAIHYSYAHLSFTNTLHCRPPCYIHCFSNNRWSTMEMWNKPNIICNSNTNREGMEIAMHNNNW